MNLSIGQLAERAGLSTPTIRYYEEVELLPRPMRASGRRVYDEGSIDRLLVITFAKERVSNCERFVSSSMASRVTHLRVSVGRTSRQQSSLQLEALAARIEVMKKLLREALRCGCVELDACGKLFRSRANRHGIPRSTK